MKWITREGAKTDRVACPWLIRRFLDKEAEFVFVSKDKVLETAKRLGGKSFDAAGADYTHRGNKCSFEVLIEDHKLTDPALDQLARIVHGADIDGELDTAPEAAGLLAMAEGFHKSVPDDHEKLRLQFPVYDALYAYCRHGR
ncbi:MAG: chromate resistance protein [Elusimicrobia bacterium]|nr:chromate resistance protein [Elusimicrobiota bacterium]